MMFVLADDGHGRHLRLWRISLHDDLYDDCNGKMAKCRTHDSTGGIFVMLKIYEKSGETGIDHRFSCDPDLKFKAECRVRPSRRAQWVAEGICGPMCRVSAMCK